METKIISVTDYDTHSIYFDQFTPLLADYYLETLFAENENDSVALDQRLSTAGMSLKQIQQQLLDMKQSGVLNEREKQKLQKHYDQGQTYILLFVDDILVGMARLLHRDREVGQLHTVFVHPSYQGNHLGSKLLDRVIEVAKDTGYTAINLTTQSFMRVAIGLYQSRGFEIVDYLDFTKYRSDSEKQKNIVYMQKKL